MTIRLLILAVLLVAYEGLTASAKDFAIDTATALRDALDLAQPGDSLVMRSGEWSDVRIVFRARGTQAAPIVLKAAVPGQTVMTGKSTLRIGGEHLVVEGLLFRNPDPAVSDLIQFGVDSDELALNCRMTNCGVIGRPDNATGESRWVGLYGEHNRVDHCHFEGKVNKGTTVVVWLGNGNKGQHQIDHNYFGPRPVLGENGGETIRLGDSKTSMLNAKCLVECNLFEKCNGEAECISNKSCGNTYRENTFLEVSGTLTLRHGNSCLVERNVFMGNSARGTGGIRIIGEDHIVRRNFLSGLAGDDGRSAISLMMGIPDSPAHRYFQVKQAVVENNSIVDCKHSLLIGLSGDVKATLAPVETIIRGNVIVSPKRPCVEARCRLDGISWQDNHFTGKELGIPPVEGIATDRVEIGILAPLTRGEVGTNW